MAKAPKYDSLRRAFDLTIKLGETDTTMHPGMSVQVEVLDAIQDKVLLAPRAALSFEKDLVSVLFEDGHSQSVEIGPCSAHECIILSGLEAGASLQARSP